MTLEKLKKAREKMMDELANEAVNPKLIPLRSMNQMEWLHKRINAVERVICSLERPTCPPLPAKP